MARYLLQRLIQSVTTLLFLVLLIFLMGRALGDPVLLLLPIDATQEAEERLRTELGLDRPLYTQFALYVGGLLEGDLGRSIRSQERVTKLLGARLVPSAQLAGAAFAFALVISLPLGVGAAITKGSALESVIKGIALLGLVLPAFWVGIILIGFFAVKLRWLPAGGYGSLEHLVLPAFTQSLFLIGGLTRLLRTTMLDTLDEEFILFARIKGLPKKLVIWKHALRNALIPVITFAGVYLALFLTMSIAVEVVFGWPGLGRLVFTAILNRDYPVMQGFVLLAGIAVITVSFAVDIIYVMVDPRIRKA